MAVPQIEGYVSRTDLYHIDPLKIVVVNNEETFHNPRRDELTPESLEPLKNAIRARGSLIRPLTVWRNGNTIELVGGHRRLACIKMLIGEGMEFKSVPVIFDKSKTPLDRFVSAIIDNDGAEPLTHLDEAYAIEHLQRQGLTVEDIAKKTGWKIATIYNRLRLLQANETVLTELKNKTITASDTLAIIKAAKEQGKSQEEILQQFKTASSTNSSSPRPKRERKTVNTNIDVDTTGNNNFDNLDKETARIKNTLTHYIDTIGLDLVMRYIVDHEGIDLVAESLRNLGVVELAAEDVQIVEMTEATC